MAACENASLCFDVSSNAHEAGYQRPSVQHRLAATRASGRAPRAIESKGRRKKGGTTSALDDLPPDSTYPACLVLPGDELSWKAKYPPQSFRPWNQLKERDIITNRRRAVYVLAPPEAAEEAQYVSTWCVPNVKETVKPPAFEDVVNYLQAFYHGLPVKAFSEPKLRFCEWDGGARKKAGAKAERSIPKLSVALKTGLEAIRIRARVTATFSAQLNLNDLLDAALSILPDDAYALLIVLHHDLYEDDDGGFCCRRAYGGSRVAVVSAARYNPALHAMHEVDRQHAWPASYCKQYIDQCCTDSAMQGPKTKKRKVATSDKEAVRLDGAAMGAALAAHIAHSQSTLGIKQASHWLETLWLGRVCKTASHELGHCFGIDDCTYWACVMQETAGMGEDVRQPPYVCPVDTTKLLKATGADEKERNRALLAFVSVSPMTPCSLHFEPGCESGLSRVQKRTTRDVDLVSVSSRALAFELAYKYEAPPLTQSVSSAAGRWFVAL